MQNLLLRFLVSLLIFSLGMGAVYLGIQSVGSDSPDNLAWVFASGFIHIEWIIIQGLVIAAIGLTLGILSYRIVEWLNRPTKEQIEWKERDERFRIAARDAEYRRQEDERIAEIHRQRAKQDKERTDEKEARRLKFQNRTPEEKKRDALNELTKGW